MKLLFAPFVTILGLIFFSQAAWAATINYSPASGTQYVGSSFNVGIYVNTQGAATNSYQADIRFPADKLDVTSVSTGGSICTLFPFQPSYGSGTAQIQCGLPSPGYNGTSGKLGTVTFRAKSTGSAVVTLASSSQVLANDGSGTNVLTSLGNATFTVTNPPTTAPVITSPTHPDQNSWYKTKSVTFTWSGGYSGYSYDFNQTLETIPDQSSEGNGTSKTYDNVTDGVWYLSIRGNGASGWSGTTHYKVQIDTNPPNPFQPVTDPVGESSVRPTISFSTTDALSGIDHYEVKLDNGAFFQSSNPYRPDRISSGEHTFTIRAVDKAGNFTDGSAKVRIKEIPTPSLTAPFGGFLKFLEKLQVTGTGPADGVVAVFLNDKVIGQEIPVGKDGKWSFSYDQTLMPDKYRLYAVVTQDGIESRASNEVDFTVDASALSIGPATLPAGFVIILLLLALAAAVALSSYLVIKTGRKVYVTAGNFRDRIRGLREEVNEDLSRLEHRAEGDIEETLQGKNPEELRDMEHKLEGRVEEDIERTKGDIKGDIDATEKGVKGP